MLIAKRLLLLSPLFALLASCSEDFKVGAPYRPITVIYGLMNMADTAHYIRVQKAFLDENISSLVMAKDVDSNFYSSIKVQLKEIGSNLTVTETLNRVDLNNEGFKKDTGVFFNAPNYAYKTKRFLDPANTYRIVVTNTATGQVDSAETSIINADPNAFRIDDFYSEYKLNFQAVFETNNYTLLVRAPSNAQIFEGIIRFHWANKNEVSGVQTDDSADWSFNTTEKSGDAVTLSTRELSFYSFLRDRMGPASTGITRYMDSADIFVWAGSNELATYRKINGAQGGLTADQIKPLYTNIKSSSKDGALGLFTTRARREFHGAGIDLRTLDALSKKPITEKLNIAKVMSDH
jgi:hypothetical protein